MVSVLHPIDAVTFVLLVLLNIVLGLYFALYKGRRTDTTNELFLGSRSLEVFPLALSTMATAVSGVGIIGFTAHFYIYGLHINWTAVSVLLAMPFFRDVVLTVLYKLQVTSLFEVSPRTFVQLIRLFCYA